MRKSYAVLAISILAVAAFSGPAVAQDQIFGVSGVTNCIGIQEAANTAGLALTQGETYTVTVDGDAFINPLPGGEFQGVFCFYHDNSDPDHPVVRFLEKGDSFEFVASASNFYAFLVDKANKDIPDNGGSMTVTLSAPGGARETVVVDGVFNCIGLEDFNALKPILLPGNHYVVSVSGDSYANGTPSGGYDGILMFTRDASIGAITPVQLALDYGEHFIINEMHATGWVYLFYVDESYTMMGNNGGKATVLFDDWTDVEEETWGAIKSIFQ
jgi:hypothetical protein